jgi:hypothetical protein
MRLAINLSKVELKMSEDRVTGRMGLSWLVHGMKDFGLRRVISDEYGNKRGSNREISAWRKVMTGVMTLVAGGERVEDVEVLRKDAGLLESLGWDEMNCADTQLNFVKDRRNNARNRKVNDRIVITAMKLADVDEMTYDNDATYIDSGKDSAAYSYQGRKQFSGLLGYIPELGLINTVDYRPGNKSPQTGILNQLRKTCQQAGKAGKRIARFRSDSAAHQDRIFTYCDMEGIEYYISLDKNEIIKRTIKKLKPIHWKTMYGKYKERHDTEWAEAEYVVEKGYRVRALILRWPNPDPTLFDASPYCYHVVGTNNWEIEPMEWLEVHNGRMGTIEQVNKELKSGFGCDYTPSHEFEKNRGYFLLGVLAYNMAQIMKLFYLGCEAARWTIKTMRYRFIHVCGKIVKSGRRFTCKIINVGDEIFELFRYCHMRLKIAA